VARTLLDGGAGITLDQTGNTVSGNVTLTSLNTAGDTLQGGAITFFNSTGFNIASASIVEPGIGTTGPATLQAGGPITETGSIVADLVVRTMNDSGAAITLDNPANAITGTVTLTALNAAGNALAAGNITLFNSLPITIADASGSTGNPRETGIGTTATATLQAGGTIAEASGAAVAAGNLVVRTQLTNGADIKLDQSGNAVTGTVTLTALSTNGDALDAGSITFTNSARLRSPGWPMAGRAGSRPGSARPTVPLAYR